MAEIVNLRRVRKARERAAATVQAETMRARHGRTGAERAADAAQVARLNRVLDGARRETGDHEKAED